MKKTLLITASLLVCLCLSIAASAQKTKTASCGQSASNLTLQIFDTYQDASGNNVAFEIRSDGKGLYVPTKDTPLNLTIRDVSVPLNSSCIYDFVLNIGSRTSRFLNVNIPNYAQTTSTFNNFDRIGSVPVTDMNNPAFSAFCGDGINIVNANSQFDNYAGCGYDGQRYYARRNVGVPTTLRTGERVRFQNSPYDGGTNAGGTSYIRVYASYDPNGYTAKDANGNFYPNTWELSPEPFQLDPNDPSSFGTWAALLDGNAVRIGTKKMSFVMILRRPK